MNTNSVDIGREDERGYNKLRNYLLGCLENSSIRAGWEQTHDTQTRMIIDYLKCIPSGFSLLDYGCGNMRVLNSLHSKMKSKWNYSGYDPLLEIEQIKIAVQKVGKFSHGQTWEVVSREEMLGRGACYDIVLVQNVIHEIGYFRLASLLQDMRLVLSPNGVMLLMETPFPPKGEPRFVPWYQWDSKLIFAEYEDLSEYSPRGLPILFHVMPKHAIPYYGALLRALPHLLNSKRAAFARLAYELDNDNNRELQHLINLGMGKIFDYTYLLILIGNITLQLEKLDYTLPSEIEIRECALALIKYFIELKTPTTKGAVYDNLGRQYSFESICVNLQTMLNHNMFIHYADPLDGSGELTHSEIFDILEDNVDWKKYIEEDKFEKALVEARFLFSSNYPGNQFGL